jgi:hypothetical protein
MDTTIYTLKEFAEKIKVSTRTLVRWHESGKFTAKINPSGKMFYTKEDFDAYIGDTEGTEGLMTEDEALMTLLDFSQEDIAEDRVISAREFRERLSQRRNLGE